MPIAGRGGSYYARKRRVQGDRAFKKLLIRMPAAIREEIVRMLTETGRSILAAQRSAAPVKTGAVRQALSMRVLEGALQLKVGIVGRPLNRRLFYANIVERGRMAQTVSVERLHRGARATWLGRVRSWGVSVRRKPGDLVSRYQMRVRALAPHPFIYSAQAEAGRLRVGGAIQGFWENVLSSASQGATDD